PPIVPLAVSNVMPLGGAGLTDQIVAAPPEFDGTTFANGTPVVSCIVVVPYEIAGGAVVPPFLVSLSGTPLPSVAPAFLSAVPALLSGVAPAADPTALLEPPSLLPPPPQDASDSNAATHSAARTNIVAFRLPVICRVRRVLAFFLLASREAGKMRLPV